MPTDGQFDTFYHATRDALVHQTFALTGDLPAAQSAVRDAYVAAWHHWRKVASCDDPQDWVRPRAWQLAQRRHSARLWHRNKNLSAENKAVLDAIAKLPVGQRKVLLLTQLAGLSLAQTAREVGITRDMAERQLQAATAGMSVALDVGSTSIRSHLTSLVPATAAAKLPRASIIRRAGRKRRRAHTAVAAVAATAVSVAAGAFVHQPDQVQASDDTQLVAPQPAKTSPPPKTEDPLPTASELLDQHQIERLGMKQDWRVTRTHDNTSGSGINSVCQQERFADPDGVSALVREFHARGEPKRSAVQSIEISDSAKQAAKAFKTTVGWYAGCQAARLQLLDAYKVNRIGNQAHVLMIRVWEKPVTTYSVAVARIGRVVTSTIGRTVGGRPPPPQQITQSLADAASMLCSTSGAKDCSATPTYSSVPPPPSGEDPGLLAVADLPPVGRVEEPWVGTDATRTRENPAATTCDRADFMKAGAQRSRTRTFLIPGAKMPSRFGLSETYGEFKTARQARRFVDTMRSRVANCEDGSLATDVRDPVTSHPRPGMEMSTWDISTEISENESVMFRLGFVRLDNKVAEVNFAPAEQADVSDRKFAALVERAGERLHELG